MSTSRLNLTLIFFLMLLAACGAPQSTAVKSAALQNATALPLEAQQPTEEHEPKPTQAPTETPTEAPTLAPTNCRGPVPPRRARALA